MTAINQDLEIWAGETKDIDVTVLNDLRLPVDLTDASIVWRVKRDWYSEEADVDKSPEDIVIVDAAAGLFLIHLSGTDTSPLFGNYLHEARITYPSGAIDTVLVGKLLVHRSLFV